MTDSYLEHHGVKGMHWGVRKAEDSTYLAAPKKGSKFDPKRTAEYEKAGKRSVVRSLVQVGVLSVGTGGGLATFSKLTPMESKAWAPVTLAGGALGAAGGIKLNKELRKQEKIYGKMMDNTRSQVSGTGVVWKTDKTPLQVLEDGHVSTMDYLKSGAKNVLLGPAGLAAGFVKQDNRQLQGMLEEQTFATRDARNIRWE